MKKLCTTLLLFFLLQISIQAQGPIYLPIVVKNMIAGDNKWRYIKPVASTNYVLNPSGEISGNYSAIGTATITTPSTDQRYGLQFYRVVPNAVGDGIQFTLGTLTNTEHFVSVRVKGPFSDLQATIGSATKDLRLIKSIDKSLAFEWQLWGIGFTAAEANGQTTLDITSVDGSSIFRLDGVQVEALPYWTTYIDGTQPGCEWLGAANASISRRSGESRAGGEEQDFFNEYGFMIEKIVGGSATSRRLSVDSYSILPGGELNNVKVEPRTFNIIGRFYADTEEELHAKQQALKIELFDTSYVNSQPFRIRFNGAAVQKEIEAHYRGGLEGDLPAFYGENTGVFEPMGVQWAQTLVFTEKVSIEFESPDPFWHEIGNSAIVLDSNDSATFRIVAGRLRDTGQWDALGPPNAAGTYTQILAMAEDDTYIYFGGTFDNFDNIANADNIVRWHKLNETWSALSSGTNGTVRALVVGADGTLYATGSFTTAGGGAAARIAAWDPSAGSWSALGAGIDDVGRALAIGLNGLLYVAGDFLNAGGAGANRIASWNPVASTWGTLGAGLDAAGLALAVGIDGLIYVGGSFANAGGSAAAKIASWNPDDSTWSALGSGITGTVQALVVDRATGLLYIGGSITVAGGDSVSNIAGWNGSAFFNLGDGIDGAVASLSIGPDSLVYASGDFDSAGGLTLADDITRWNGSAFAHLDVNLPGANTTPYVFASQKSDPTIKQKYDFWVGFDASGTGTFAGLVTPDNEGNVPAFPMIIYNRSGGTTATLETLRNERTGLEIFLNYGLLDGETLTIDLNPSNRTITSSLFGSRLDAKLPGSDWSTWSLLPGDNDITTFVNTSGTPTITAYMLWRQTFDGYN